MSADAAQIQFAAEFVTLLMAAAGLALVVLSAGPASESWWTRLALAVGFLALGAAAFGHGSLLLKDDRRSQVDGLRVLGVVALAVGSMGWRAGRGARRLVWLALAVVSAAVLADRSDAARLADGLLAAGSLMLGVALLSASRRSIAARVAASAAATLLLVVLVLSVALSAVLASSAQREELNRLSARGRTEGRLATDGFLQEVQTARFVGEYLEKGAAANLVNVGGAPQPAAADRQAIGALLAPLHALYPVGGLAYLAPSGAVVATFGSDPAVVRLVAATALIRQAACPGPVDRGSAMTVGGQVLSVAAYPECLGAQRLGVVLRLSPLDSAYLEQRHRDDTSLSLALATGSGEAGHIGPQPPIDVASPLTKLVLATGSSTSRATASWFVAGQPIQSSENRTVAAVVVSTPTSALVTTRERLYRTLFLIALGGTLLALGLAALVGDRITAGLRRLTRAAERVRRGDVGQRVHITGHDEVAVLGAAFDSMVASIEQQTAALQSAAESETRLRNRLEAVVAGMGDALIAVDATGLVSDFNRAAEELTGVAATAARGRAIAEVLDLRHDNGRPLGTHFWSPSSARRGLVVRLVAAGGQQVPVAISAGPLRGRDDAAAGSVLVLRDLRRERELERMKTEFLSRVGHELRTPLTGIMGYADMLVRRPVEPAQARAWHTEIVVAAKRLLRIVEMLEFVASSGAGRVPVQPDRIEVRGLVEAAVAEWSGRLPANLRLTERVEGATPLVMGDRRWLALAIDELIDNAVKFSPDGGTVEVTASAVRAAGNGRGTSVEISVVDPGKGMSPEELASAFGEFVQGDASDTRRFGGLGLGLSLVQRVVEGHGGQVACNSTPGRGSTFTVTLPATLPEASTAGGPAGAPRAAPSPS